MPAMPVEVTRYVDRDYLDLVDALGALRADGVPYPTQDAGHDPVSLGVWLTGKPALGRWSARVDGRAVGHVQSARPHPYLADWLGGQGLPWATDRALEVSKLFVHPEHHGAAGTALLTAAVEHARFWGREAVLTVAAASVPAVRMCERQGLVHVGSYHGFDGVQHVYASCRLT